MKTGRTTRSGDTTRAFAVLAIALAKGAAAARKSPAASNPEPKPKPRNPIRAPHPDSPSLLLSPSLGILLCRPRAKHALSLSA